MRMYVFGKLSYRVAKPITRPWMLFSILAASSGAAFGQCQLDMLAAEDGAADDKFGWSVSVSGDTALIGAWEDDDDGNNSGSVYVFVRDGVDWWQEAKLLANDGANGDHFGRSVSVDGDIALIGALFDDDNGPDSGSAYVFRYDETRWAQGAKLLPADGNAGDHFGNAVSVSGDVAAIAAYTDGENGFDSGSTYVFRFADEEWTQEAKLLPADGAYGDFFGESVSVSGNAVIVGAHHDDDMGDSSGSAYIFRYNDAGWVEEAKLLPSDGAAGDHFGLSISLSDDVALIGARGHGDNGALSGAAYVFRFNGSAWIQEAKLLASDGGAGDQFGFAVSASGDVAVVGARSDDDDGTDSGSSYIFRHNGRAWEQQGKMSSSDNAAFDEFGKAVSVSGETVVIGAYLDDDNGEDSGTAHVFDVHDSPDGNTNDHPDHCDLLFGLSQDCNENLIPDECDLVSGISDDCNANEVPDECEPDCNGNGVNDECDIEDGAAPDCNGNEVPDSCDIAEGSSEDINGNGLPDECECVGDLNLDGMVAVTDLVALIAFWGPCEGCIADLNNDGLVGVGDLVELITRWGPCL